MEVPPLIHLSSTQVEIDGPESTLPGLPLRFTSTPENPNT